MTSCLPKSKTRILICSQEILHFRVRLKIFSKIRRFCDRIADTQDWLKLFWMIHLSSPNFIITFLYSVVKVPRQYFTYFDAIFLPSHFKTWLMPWFKCKSAVVMVVVSIMHTDIRLCFALTRVGREEMYECTRKSVVRDCHALQNTGHILCQMAWNALNLYKKPDCSIQDCFQCTEKFKPQENEEET